MNARTIAAECLKGKRPKPTSEKRRRQAVAMWKWIKTQFFDGYSGPCIEWDWHAISLIELELIRAEKRSMRERKEKKL
jgi:hypothetical protein